MQPGDKVKFLNENLDGIITRIIDDKTMGVEISDGFEIPVLRNEIVVIGQNKLSGEVEHKIEDKSNIKFKDPGLFVLLEQHVGSYYQIKILNHFEHEIIFAIYKEKDKVYKLLTKGQLLSGKALSVEQLDFTMPEKWPVYHFYLIPLMGQSSLLPLVAQYKFSYRAKDLMHYTEENSRRRYSIKLLTKAIEPDLDITDLVKNFDADIIEKEATIALERPQVEVDLHIEKITKNYIDITPEVALDIQFREFENNFDKAISLGYDRITFIHGVGNGTLKYMIRKHLSQNKSIKSFRDAQKEKFGYGATEVFLK
ncbi:MAG: Smr/MutS family protein [Bacteroidota bacterium]|nr:Smr/MutS family protein [Bacteroidota bacterium]